MSKKLEELLRGAGKHVEFHFYPGVKHWFFEEDRPEYDSKSGRPSLETDDSVLEFQSSVSTSLHFSKGPPEVVFVEDVDPFFIADAMAEKTVPPVRDPVEQTLNDPEGLAHRFRPDHLTNNACQVAYLV